MFFHKFLHNLPPRRCLRPRAACRLSHARHSNRARVPCRILFTPRRSAACPAGFVVTPDPSNPGPPPPSVPPSGTAPAADSWVLRHRLVVPEPPAGYCDRPELTARCDPTRRRTVLVMAPGGFGKTTVLAAACRQASADGVPVAWLTLDPGDDDAALDAYLAVAFRAAGVDPLDARAAPAAAQRHPRTALTLRAVEERGAPCVLALDELERVTDPDAVALLAFLLHAAPPCLHLALACRDLPPGLDATPVLGADAEFVTASDLAFSRPDVARFFSLSLSRAELDAVYRESSGWPIALRIRKNRDALSESGSRVARNVVDRWIEGRFWDSIPDADRERLLDLGVFEWIDEDLAVDVFDVHGILRRLADLPALAGLLERVDRSARVYRLHPLLREHCAGRRQRKTPARHRALHRRLARALARRGHTVDAMRHATAAGDRPLAGRLFLDSGGLQRWVHEGTDRLIAASRLLDEDSIAAEPRLALARAVVLALAGRLGEARDTCAAATANANGTDAGPAFALEARIAHGMIRMTGAASPGTEDARAHRAAVECIADTPSAPTALRAGMAFTLCFRANQQGDFAAARARARRARRLPVGGSKFIAMALADQLGQIAMATGRVRDARKWYGALSRFARAHFLDDPRFVGHAEALTRELDLERGRLRTAAPGEPRSARDVYRGGVHCAHYAAATELALDRASARSVDDALVALDDMWGYARDTGLEMLERLVPALRVSVLADAGRLGEAERTWQTADLPATDAGCIDLQSQSWREMEAVACARLRLLARRGNLQAARRLAARIDRVATGRNLVRTRMRALALRVQIEHHAGARGAVRTALRAYLDLYAGTDYARPLARLRAGPALLGRLLDADADRTCAPAAAALLARIARGAGDGAPRLTARQRDVLRRLPTQPDKAIARALGLTVDGVRYHLRAVYRKLGVGSRCDAVSRARRLGILPPPA